MPPSVHRWSDMAKAPKTVKVAADNNVLGALPSELLVDGTSVTMSSVYVYGQDGDVDGLSYPGGDEDIPDEDADEAQDEPHYVVLKGKTVKHDGVVYNEHNVIPITGADADRLLCAGVIADYNDLLRRVMTAAPAVTVTTE